MAGWMLAVASLVAASTANAAQNQKIKLVPVGTPFHVQRSLTMGRGASLAFDLAAYEKTKPLSRCVLTNFTLESGRAVDLDLQQFTVFDRQTQFVAGTPEGDKPLAAPDVVLFRGKVIGVEDSRAVLAVSPHGSVAKIYIGKETFLLQSTWQGREAASGATATIEELNSRLVHGPRRKHGATPIIVGDQEAGTSPDTKGPSGPSGVDPANFRVADIAMDGDYGFYQLMGSDTGSATTLIVSLLAQASDIYERDLGLKLWLVYLRVWTTPDPLGDTLDEFKDWWNNNMGSVARNNATKITNYLVPTDASGIGIQACNLSLLCTPSYAYVITETDGILDALDEVATFAQELGHNCGSPHTHCYNPPVDHCYNEEASTSCQTCYSGPVQQTVGTIMSYCDTINLAFGPAEQAFIQPKILANGCLTVARDPTYVNFAYSGSENGTASNPWSTLTKGVRGVIPGGTILIGPGNSQETLTIRERATLRVNGVGTVNVGR